MAYTDRRQHAITIAVEIEGIPWVFVERAEDDTLFADAGELAGNRPQLPCVTDVQLGRQTLNLDTRTEEGASLTITCRDLDRSTGQPWTTGTAYVVGQWVIESGAAYVCTHDHTAGTFADDLDDQYWHASGPLLWLCASRTRAENWVAATVSKSTAMTGGGLIDIGVNASGAEYFWIGGETFHGTSVLAKKKTDVRRSLYGSPAQTHFGGYNVGDASRLFLTPPNWTGRRVTVWAIFGRDDEKLQIAEGRLDAPPQFGEGNTWTFRASSLANWYREAPIYYGQRAVVLERNEIAANDGIKIPRHSFDLFDVNADSQSYVLLKLLNLDGHILVRATGNDSASFTVNYRLPEGHMVPDLWQRAVQAQTPPGVFCESAQHVGIVEGPAATVALRVLLSKLGDGTNSAAYDVLPGGEALYLDGNVWQMGAGLDAADVDDDSFREALGEAPNLTAFLTQPTTVGDFLNDLCRVCGCYWYVNGSGQLALDRLRWRAPVGLAAETVAVTDTRLAEATLEALEVDETAIAHTRTLFANYEPLADRHAAVVSTVDAEIFQRFPHSSNAKEHKSNLLHLDVAAFIPTGEKQRLVARSTATTTAARQRLRSEQTAAARPTVTFGSVRVAFDAAGLRPGQIVNVTNDRLPDMEGARVVSPHPHLIVGRELDLEGGLVVLDLRKIERGYQLGPTGVVASWDGGTTTITLDTTTRYGGATPGDDFAAGWDVLLWDMSAGTIAPEAAVIDSVTSTQIVLTLAPSFTPAAGDLITVEHVAASNACADGFDLEDALYMVDSAGLIVRTGTDPAGTRWS